MLCCGMKSLLFVLGSVVITAGSSFAQTVADDPEAIEIKLRYQVGKTYEVVSEVTTKTEFDMAGEKMINDQALTFVVDNEVSAVEDSEDLSLLMTYTRVAMVVEAMGERMVYDSAIESDEEGDENPVKRIGEIVGKKITIVITPAMEITKIDGLDEIFNDGDGAVLDEETMLEFKKEQVKQLSGLHFLALMPGKPVKEGDEWPYTMEMTMPMMGNLEIKGTSTLREINLVAGRLQAVVEVNAKGKTVVNKDDEADDVQPVLGVAGQVKKMDMKGDYVIDLDAGYVVNTTVDSDIVMMMDMGNGGAAMEVPIKNTAKSTTIIK